MLGLGTGEIIAIVLVIFLLFGATRLPQLAKSIGQSRKAFKDALRDAEQDEKTVPRKPALDSKNPPGDLAAMSDEEIMAEMRRRTASGPD
jgi:sec-independent protein translocase protein TatA